METESEECAAKRWEGGSYLRAPPSFSPAAVPGKAPDNKCCPLGVWHLTALRSPWAHLGKGVRGLITHHPDTTEEPTLPAPL